MPALTPEDRARLELIRDHDGNDLSENDAELLTRLAKPPEPTEQVGDAEEAWTIKVCTEHGPSGQERRCFWCRAELREVAVVPLERLEEAENAGMLAILTTRERLAEVEAKATRLREERDSSRETLCELSAQGAEATRALSRAEEILTQFDSEDLEKLGLTIPEEISNAGIEMTRLLEAINGIEPGIVDRAVASRVTAFQEVLTSDDAVEAAASVFLPSGHLPNAGEAAELRHEIRAAIQAAHTQLKEKEDGSE